MPIQKKLSIKDFLASEESSAESQTLKVRMVAPESANWRAELSYWPNLFQRYVYRLITLTFPLIEKVFLALLLQSYGISFGRTSTKSQNEEKIKECAKMLSMYVEKHAPILSFNFPNFTEDSSIDYKEISKKFNFLAYETELEQKICPNISYSPNDEINWNDFTKLVYIKMEQQAFSSSADCSTIPTFLPNEILSQGKKYSFNFRKLQTAVHLAVRKYFDETCDISRKSMLFP